MSTYRTKPDPSPDPVESLDDPPPNSSLGYGAAPSASSGRRPPPSSASVSYPGKVSATPEREPLPTSSETAPIENLALLPTEVCGLRSYGPEENRPANRTDLLQYPWIARLGYSRGKSDLHTLRSRDF